VLWELLICGNAGTPTFEKLRHFGEHLGV